MTMPSAFRHDIADAVLSLPVTAALGLTFTELANGHAVTGLAWRPEHSHTAGAFQANPIAALADFTARAPESHSCLLAAAATVDFTVKFLTEARGSHLVARGRVLRAGTTLSVAAVNVYAHGPE